MILAQCTQNMNETLTLEHDIFSTQWYTITNYNAHHFSVHASLECGSGPLSTLGIEFLLTEYQPSLANWIFNYSWFVFTVRSVIL